MTPARVATGQRGCNADAEEGQTRPTIEMMAGAAVGVGADAQRYLARHIIPYSRVSSRYDLRQPLRFAIFSASPSGALIGIIVAGLNAVGQLAWPRHYPEWSLVIIFIDILIIYGLAVYGTQDRIDVAEVA